MKGKKAFMLNDEMYFNEARIEEYQEKKKKEKDEEKRKLLEGFSAFAGRKVDFRSE